MRATSSGTVVLLRARRDVHVGARYKAGALHARTR